MSAASAANRRAVVALARPGYDERDMKARAFAAMALAMSLITACERPAEPPPTPKPPATTVLDPAPDESVTAVNAPSAAVTSEPLPAAPFVSKRVQVEDKAMGTHLLVASYTTPLLDEPAIKLKLAKAIDEVRRLEGLMTTWRPDSEISRINSGAGKSGVVVSPETLSVIQKSIWMSDHSEGVFDITFEAMHGLWKFDEDHDERIPKRDDVERLRKLIDYKQIQVNEATREVKLKKAGMRMSLGGIAKGYAVDAAAKVLENEGLTSYFVQAGGDLYVRGKKLEGAPWKVGVRDPRGQDSNDYFALLEVEDHAFSTAGDYERSFVQDKKRYHHIIDPRTGYPATASRSVTIWAKDAFTADAIDDAVFILGPKKGLELIESIDGCGGVIVDANNKVWVSKRIKDKLKMLRQPTDGI
jgi:thiamine biosynthesis lipoprotein